MNVVARRLSISALEGAFWRCLRLSSIGKRLDSNGCSNFHQAGHLFSDAKVLPLNFVRAFVPPVSFLTLLTSPLMLV